MIGQNKGMSCALGCWAMAGGIGALAFVLLLVAGDTGFIGAVFLSGVAAGVLGLLFSFLFCRELPGPVVPGSATVAPKTAPRAAAPAPTAPAASAPTAPAKSAAATSDAKPEVSTASASADAEAGARVKPSKPLAGQDDLATRKGEWKYDGGEAAQPTKGATAATAADDAGAAPQTLSAPRAGGADDLKKIKGIGPKLEKVCNDMGFYHFDQIANWTDAEVAWVDQNLEGFKGRVSRDEWVTQAKSLAAGNETEFSNRVDKGDVY